MLHPKPRTSEFLYLKSPEDVSAHGLDARTVTSQSQIVWKKKRYNYLKKLKGMWIFFGSICWTTMETKTLKWWKFQDLGQLGESSSRCRHGIFFGAKKQLWNLRGRRGELKRNRKELEHLQYYFSSGGVFFERLWKCIVQLSGNFWEVTMGTRDFTSTSYLMICRCIFAKLTTHWVTDVTKLSLVSPEHRSTLPTSVPVSQNMSYMLSSNIFQTVVKAERSQYLSSHLIVEI